MSLQEQINRFAGRLDAPYAFAAINTGVLDAATAEAVVKILSFELQSQAVHYKISGQAYEAGLAESHLITLQQAVATDGALTVVSGMNQVALATRIQALADLMKLPAPAATSSSSGGGSNRTAVILGVGMAIFGITIGITYLVHKSRAQRERAVISGNKPLTTKQIEALKQILHDGRTNPFDFGSTTVSRLRKEGLVENDRSTGVNRLVITEAGRKLIGG